MKRYICKICRQPLRLDDKALELMWAFDMPEDGGAHAECLRRQDRVRANTEPLRELAQDAPKSNVGDK